MKPLKERFESKFRVTPGCWIWTASTSRDGYGKIGVKVNGEWKRTYRAHRASHELYVGPIQDGLFVLHKCDNPLCVNPDHLFVGSNRDNVLDMVRKGRNRAPMNRGEENGNSKLTAAIARSIFVDTRSLRTIAKDHKISHCVVVAIKKGRAWKSATAA